MDKKLEPIDLTFLRNYSEKYVVISFDYKKVIASGDEISDLGESITKGVIMYVRNPNYSYH